MNSHSKMIGRKKAVLKNRIDEGIEQAVLALAHCKRFEACTAASTWVESVRWRPRRLSHFRWRQMSSSFLCKAAQAMHHSDREVQHAALDYQDLLAQHQIRPSMSRRANCYDNAVVESFFATLEWELIDRCDWATRDAARVAIFDYLECWYNRQRRHTSLSYLSPMEYEQKLLSQAA